MFNTMSSSSSGPTSDATYTGNYWRVYRESWPIAWAAVEPMRSGQSVHRRYQAAHELVDRLALSFCDVVRAASL